MKIKREDETCCVCEERPGDFKLLLASTFSGEVFDYTYICLQCARDQKKLIRDLAGRGYGFNL